MITEKWALVLNGLLWVVIRDYFLVPQVMTGYIGTNCY